MPPIVHFEKVTKKFGDLAVVDEISGSIFQGEIVSLVGPSGCGKSTLLRMIVGVETASGGKIQCHIQPKQIGFVFQDVRLLPWKTALQNITFVLRDRFLAQRQQESRARKVLARVGLADFQNYLPAQLSGGMQKRVAIARALAIDPELLIFDEPFSDLDLPLRMLLIEDIHRLLKNGDKTAIYVTHDIREALTLSDRVYILSARPARIVEVITLNGKRRESGQNASLTPELAEIETQILAILQNQTKNQIEKTHQEKRYE